MITDKFIKINIVPANYNYYKQKGYDVNINTPLEISINDLPEKSNVEVLCSCDVCGNSFKNRFSRNKDFCAKCVNKNRKIIKKNIKVDKKTIEELLLKNNKGKVCEILKTSRSTLEKWIKEYDITCPRYLGVVKYYEDDLKKYVEIINQYLIENENATINEITKILNIPKQAMRIIRKQNLILFETYFDKQKMNRRNIEDNLSLYIEENKTKTLKQITNDYNISIEQLKKVFQENEIEVKLHSFNKSKGEIECKEFIRSKGIQCDSVMFDKKYEIDCFSKEKNFGIEYCGEYWHRYTPEKNNKKYHQKKTLFFIEKNIKIMTIFENEWKTKKELIQSMILSRLGLCKTIFARKCALRVINTSQAKRFHEHNHINGYVNSSINIGLFFNTELVSVISFSKSRFDKNFEYEITRFSSKRENTVVGGFSKMFNFFVNTYKPKSCLTYADLRFGVGEVYNKNGFIDLGITPPNYFYFHKNTEKMESRMKYSKKNLKKLPNYDENKTEFEIMTENKYIQIYDCGNKKYGWFAPVF